MARFARKTPSLGHRSLIAAGAATLMVGGGVAVAQTGLQTAEGQVGEVTPADKAPELPELPDQPSDDVGGDELDKDAEEKSEGGEQELDIQELDAELDDTEGTEEEDEERSETAERVHEALTGDETSPGDEDFGQIVSERARNYRLGPAVSAAARGEDWDLERKPARGRSTEPDDAEVTEDAPDDTVEELSDDAPTDEGGKPSWAGTPGGPNSAGQS